MPDRPLRTLFDALRRNVEIGVLVLLALAVLAVWALAELTDEVLEGATRNLDRDLLLALRVPGDLSDPLGPPWLEEMGRDFTALGGTGVIAGVTLLAAGFFLVRRSLGSMLYLLAATGGGIALSSIGKEVFDRPRPDLVPHGSLVYTASFPSGHSMMAAVQHSGRFTPVRRGWFPCTWSFMSSPVWRIASMQLSSGMKCVPSPC
jgi:undecaprenyl-diphosphatase